jgi:uncharacterized protein (DUF58 family)
MSLEANTSPLTAPGVSVDAEALLRLRHLVRNAPERRLATSGRPGGHAMRRRGRGLEAVDVRVFSDGDDVRHLDRNTTARTGVPHVRTFRDERERTALLIADFRPSMLWGTRRALRSVAAAEALAAVGWRVIEAGGRVGAIAVTAAIPPLFVPARGRERGMASVVGGLAAAHRSALDETAASVSSEAAEEPPLERVLEMAATLMLNGGSVFLASALDRPGDAFDRAAGALHRRAKLTLLLVQDAFELRPPSGLYRYKTGTGRITQGHVAASTAQPTPDDRITRLRRLGVEVLSIDAGEDHNGMIRQLEGPRDGRC